MAILAPPGGAVVNSLACRRRPLVSGQSPKLLARHSDSFVLIGRESEREQQREQSEKEAGHADRNISINYRLYA